jgi:hypothetical protein
VLRGQRGGSPTVVNLSFLDRGDSPTIGIFRLRTKDTEVVVVVDLTSSRTLLCPIKLRHGSSGCFLNRLLDWHVSHVHGRAHGVFVLPRATDALRSRN